MEKKINENVKEEIKENVENKEQKIKLFVEREGFEGNDGKDYWAYILKGQVRGRDVKVDFSPKDKGGYEPLDIVFEVSPKAELIMTDEEMKNETTGKVTKYVSYRVCTIEDGIEYSCGVKPSRDSDKALLTMLLNQLKVSGLK